MFRKDLGKELGAYFGSLTAGIEWNKDMARSRVASKGYHMTTSLLLHMIMPLSAPVTLPTGRAFSNSFLHFHPHASLHSSLHLMYISTNRNHPFFLSKLWKIQTESRYKNICAYKTSIAATPRIWNASYVCTYIIHPCNECIEYITRMSLYYVIFCLFMCVLIIPPSCPCACSN